MQKILLILGKWSNWPKNLYKGTFFTFTRLSHGICWTFFLFYHFTGPEIRKKLFFGQFSAFLKNDLAIFLYAL